MTGGSICGFSFWRGCLPERERKEQNEMRKRTAAVLLAALLPALVCAGGCARRGRGTVLRYTVCFPDLPAETAEGVLVGETAVDGAGKGNAGRVVARRVSPSLRETVTETGVAVTEKPGRVDLYLTFETRATGTPPVAGTLPLQSGRPVALHLAHLYGEGTIVWVGQNG